MKISEIKKLNIGDVKVIKYERFHDNRGYFTETYRASDFHAIDSINFLTSQNFTQINESYTKMGVFRGLHFQWNPFMDKLIRCVKGKITDFALDIRPNSPNFGKIISYELSDSVDSENAEWIWVPNGFAHGFYANQNSLVEYMCTGYWSPNNEYTISIYDTEIDWTLCEIETLADFNKLITEKEIILSDKDLAGSTLKSWLNNPKSKLFDYGVNNEH